MFLLLLVSLSVCVLKLLRKLWTDTIGETIGELAMAQRRISWIWGLI